MSLRVDGLPHEVQVGPHMVGKGHPAFFIAEIGNNHNGDFYLAKRLVEESIAAGAQAVKLQKRFVNEVFTEELLSKPQTKDVIFGKTYGEYREHLELSLDDFVRLKKVAEDLGSVFFATPFDPRSVDFLEEVGVGVYKIASFDITNLPLLSYVAKKRKPMFLSTGMCTLEELDEAVRTVLELNHQLVILHCVSEYPTQDKNLNLHMIRTLQEHFAPLPIGYSGHEGDFLPTLSAVALGACAVERHITLNRGMPGPDHATVSIETEEFKAMVDDARRVELGLGTGEKAFLEDEAKVRRKHGKSVVTAVAVAKGTEFTHDMLAVKSPGTGLKPRTLQSLVGKRAACDLPADRVLQPDDIEGP